MEDNSSKDANLSEIQTSVIDPNVIETQPPQLEPNPLSPQRSKWKMYTGIILVIVILFISSGVLFVLTKNDSDKQTEKTIQTQSPTPVVTSNLNTQPVVDTSLWNSYESDEFGITFKLPPEFYWNEGRSTGPEGDKIGSYMIGVNAFVKENVGGTSCKIVGEFLREPKNCIESTAITYLALFSDLGSDSQTFRFFLAQTPTRIQFEDSLGCLECAYRYDNPIVILGNEYKVRVYYNRLQDGDFTEGVNIEGEVPAGPNSKWRTFDIHPFLGFADDAHTSYGSGLSDTSRAILGTIKYK